MAVLLWRASIQADDWAESRYCAMGIRETRGGLVMEGSMVIRGVAGSWSWKASMVPSSKPM